MKYHITPKQAKEVTEEQFYSMFNEIVPREDWANYHHRKMDVGKMIDWLDYVNIHKGFNEWFVTCYEVEYTGKELIDALWKAVKDNLE
ncbi:hypothetical protein [Niallia circulans]|uniref:hypothetical protein n=1 Tax=Niallia circulans TaxID=1397 RepID=UPI0026F31DA5|nr:hypothetical protein [Niallia circulans]